LACLLATDKRTVQPTTGRQVERFNRQHERLPAMMLRSAITETGLVA